MRFVLLTAAAFAVCSAATYYRGPKTIQVNDDGSITISNAYTGKRVTITRPLGVNGQKSMEIYIAGPNFPNKRVQIDEETGYSGFDSTGTGMEDSTRFKRSSGYKKDKSQGDVLCGILSEYQGAVDEVSYEKLMSRVDKAVKKGEISARIYDLLQSLDQLDDSGFGYQYQYQYPRFGGDYGYGSKRPFAWYAGMVPRMESGLESFATYNYPGYNTGRYGGDDYVYSSTTPRYVSSAPSSSKSSSRLNNHDKNTKKTSAFSRGYSGYPMNPWKESLTARPYYYKTQMGGYYDPYYYGGSKEDFSGREFMQGGYRNMMGY